MNHRVPRDQNATKQRHREAPSFLEIVRESATELALGFIVLMLAKEVLKLFFRKLHWESALSQN